MILIASNNISTNDLYIGLPEGGELDYSNLTETDQNKIIALFEFLDGVIGLTRIDNYQENDLIDISFGVPENFFPVSGEFEKKTLDYDELEQSEKDIINDAILLINQ